jgi:hypothetical protein
MARSALILALCISLFSGCRKSDQGPPSAASTASDAAQTPAVQQAAKPGSPSAAAGAATSGSPSEGRPSGVASQAAAASRPTVDSSPAASATTASAGPAPTLGQTSAAPPPGGSASSSRPLNARDRDKVKTRIVRSLLDALDQIQGEDQQAKDDLAQSLIESDEQLSRVFGQSSRRLIERANRRPNGPVVGSAPPSRIAGQGSAFPAGPASPKVIGPSSAGGGARPSYHTGPMKVIEFPPSTPPAHSTAPSAGPSTPAAEPPAVSPLVRSLLQTVERSDEDPRIKEHLRRSILNAQQDLGAGPAAK